jgi:hypothetical protein
MRRSLAMLLLLSAAVAASAQMIDKDHRYAVTFRHSSGDDERFTFAIKVHDKLTGEMVNVPELIATAEERVRASVSGRSANFVVTAKAHADGRAEVTLEAMRNGNLVDASVVTYAPPESLLPQKDVTIAFDGTDIRYALVALAREVKVKVGFSRGVKGKVTIPRTTLPFREALELILAQVGGRYVIADKNMILVSR